MSIHSNNAYKILAHLDKPKRWFGLTLDELLVVGVTSPFVVLCDNKIVVLLLAMAVFIGFRKLKKNKGPKFLLVMAYWLLPSKVTGFFLPKLPDSAKRFWLS